MSRSRLVLLPGLDGTGELFRPLLEVLPPAVSARVVSYPRAGPQPYGALLSYLEGQLRSEHDVVLVAESFSGPLAVRYAAAHADRVRAAVLCASFVRPPLPRWLRHVVSPLWFRVPPPARAVRRFMAGSGASDALVAAVTAAIRSVPPRVLAERLKAVLRLDCADDLRRCRAPLLYIAAGGDALVGKSSGEAVRAARPDVTVRTVDGPHLLLQAKPAEAWREIECFLRTACPAAT
jgi:pimeloyl-ACP methyl ester carboxylesterase